jgi:hypothetical protein
MLPIAARPLLNVGQQWSGNVDWQGFARNLPSLLRVQGNDEPQDLPVSGKTCRSFDNSACVSKQ